MIMSEEVNLQLIIINALLGALKDPAESVSNIAAQSLVKYIEQFNEAAVLDKVLPGLARETNIHVKEPTFRKLFMRHANLSGVPSSSNRMIVEALSDCPILSQQ